MWLPLVLAKDVNLLEAPGTQVAPGGARQVASPALDLWPRIGARGMKKCAAGAMGQGDSKSTPAKLRCAMGGKASVRSARKNRNVLGLAVPQVGHQVIGTREESETWVVVGAHNVAVSIVFGGTHVNHDVKATIIVPG